MAESEIAIGETMTFCRGRYTVSVHGQIEAANRGGLENQLDSSVASNDVRRIRGNSVESRGWTKSSDKVLVRPRLPRVGEDLG